MKILLVGTGGVGEAAAVIASQRDLEGRWLEKMVLSDYNPDRAGEVSEKIGDVRFPAEKVDARNPDEVKSLIEKYQIDLLFNACDPSFNETLFDTAYEYGIHYMDMALTLSVPHPTDPYHKTNIKMGDYQFAKHEDWVNSGKLALVGIGMDPGAVNVFARYAQKHYFDEIDEISIKDGGNLTAEGYDITFGFSIWTTIDECLNPPFKWEKEKGIYTVEPFSEPELFTFPDGIGEQELVNVEHEEMVMLPRFMGDAAKKMSFKYGLGADFITMLKNIKALRLDDKHSKIKGTRLSPRDVVGMVAPSPVEVAASLKGKCCVGTQVTGKKDGLERKIFIYQTTDNEEIMKRIGCGCVVGQTAYNPVIAMELLATGVWQGCGVLGPECFDPDPFIRLADEYNFYMGMMEMESEYKKMLDKKALLNV
ncbi:saccharopine dehydrogenase family protein [Sinanaerobacter chloroacetimidivorans]|uniref:Saccharopine dehydrogenase NADP-binding domain-containing protein n=1 Tax=Sinanaerobacter chloroacetimidivorans TaxID=2818044 RepID=A0A8J7W2D8_9FIRM|nr:saccharopine dehydrogenase NADP-binding domain-containing protein [Sinanaerobacter chloroacetimidivorans]MBR0598005.1 saccharopine dehydrogenase NADP-binding domain-containing protein [Sinanaerobacter chloroacetimidivorans]